jgi:hypothetical protein
MEPEFIVESGMGSASASSRRKNGAHLISE